MRCLQRRHREKKIEIQREKDINRICERVRECDSVCEREKLEDRERKNCINGEIEKWREMERLETDKCRRQRQKYSQGKERDGVTETERGKEMDRHKDGETDRFRRQRDTQNQRKVGDR